MDVYARLDTEEFTALVAGRPVAVPAKAGDGSTVTVKLILADIGLAEMIKIVVEAARTPEEPCILPPAAFR